MTNTLRKLGIEGNLLSLIKRHVQKPITKQINNTGNAVPNPPISVISTGIHRSGSAWCFPAYGHWPQRVRPKKEKKKNHGFCITQRSGTRQRCPLYSFLFIILAVLANVMKQENKHKAYKTRKEEINLFLLTDNTKVYVENPKNSTTTTKNRNTFQWV